MTKTRLNKFANNIQKENIVYVSQMGFSVHAQGPYKHLTPGNPDFFLKKKKKKGARSVFFSHSFGKQVFPRKLRWQAVKWKLRLRRRRDRGDEFFSLPLSPPLPPRLVSSLLWERTSASPSLYTTVLTDGSDKLSWPVMSVGGYCCRGEEKMGGKDEDNSHFLTKAAFLLFWF